MENRYDNDTVIRIEDTGSAPVPDPESGCGLSDVFSVAGADDDFPVTDRDDDGTDFYVGDGDEIFADEIADEYLGDAAGDGPDAYFADDIPDDIPDEEIISRSPVRKTPSARRRRERVVAPRGDRQTQTLSEEKQETFIRLAESLRAGRILTGTVTGVKESGSITYALISYGHFKVIIPFAFLFDETASGPSGRETEGRFLVMRRLGAEVDFIVTHIDEKDDVAIASRAAAMKRRVAEYFLPDRRGVVRVRKGSLVEARVVSVIRQGIFAEIFGREVFIENPELSYGRLYDAAEEFEPGMRVLVRILELERTDKELIRLRASVRQAAENPALSIVRQIRPGDRYIGKVKIVDRNGVFVALSIGIDCLCRYPAAGSPPRGSSVTVRIVGTQPDKGRCWGVIVHASGIVR